MQINNINYIDNYCIEQNVCEREGVIPIVRLPYFGIVGQWSKFSNDQYSNFFKWLKFSNDDQWLGRFINFAFQISFFYDLLFMAFKKMENQWEINQKFTQNQKQRQKEKEKNSQKFKMFKKKSQKAT